MRIGIIILLFAMPLGSGLSAQTVQRDSPRPFVTALSQPLARKYRQHETLSYVMRGVNQNRGDTVRYQARAHGAIRWDSAGVPFEEFQWSDLIVNGYPVSLTASSARFRQQLSLSPAFTLSIPDLSAIQPILFGPVLDLLTFYADVQLTMRQHQLLHERQRVYIEHGVPNSWADGVRVLVGEDAIDFDITLASVDHSVRRATVVVRHVPPESPAISLPADWMQTPVADTRNNWVQVTKTKKGTFVAAVGKETFDVTITVDISSGAIISATMDNLVKVLERECSNESLTNPGMPTRYTIRRQIELVRE